MKPNPEIISWLSQISVPEVYQPTTTTTTRKRPRSPKTPRPTALPFLSSTPISPPLSSSSRHCNDMPETGDAGAGAPSTPFSETPLRPTKKLKRAEAGAAVLGATSSFHRTGDGSGHIGGGDGEGIAAMDDQDKTPRQVLKSSVAASSQSSQSGTTSSRRSGRSSPLKRLRSLALRDDGIQTRPLSRGDSRLPPALVELLDEMTDIGEGIHVIPSTCRVEIEQEVAAAASAGRAPLFRPPRDTHYAASPDQTTDRSGGEAPVSPPRPEPSVQQVLGIVEWATICQKRNAEEAAWNSSVHYPILRLALHGGDRPTLGALVDVTQCTSATIISEYLSTGASGKKVDFVLHIDPTNDSSHGDVDAAARVDSCRALLPLLSINHTDHESLLREPLVVSIETKKFAADRPSSEAQVQMGTWQAAQWNLLASLTAMVSGREDSGDVGLPRLPYLPGIIVQGHDWTFVATTRESKKTILWSDCPFGSTRDLLGVYKVVCGVQRLAAFARDIYWPWYRTCVLGLPGQQPVT